MEEIKQEEPKDEEENQMMQESVEIEIEMPQLESVENLEELVVAD